MSFKLFRICVFPQIEQYIRRFSNEYDLLEINDFLLQIWWEKFPRRLLDL